MSSAPGRYAFLRSARWLRVIALGVAVSLACVALGWWQWNRHSARAEAAARVTANYDAAPVPLADLIGADGVVAAEDDWRPVTATGSYLPAGTVLLRNRPVSGVPAVHVLAPFRVRLPSGAGVVLVLDRGWLPAAAAEDPAAVPGPPEGELSVVARVRPAQEPSGRPAPPGQAYAIHPAEVLAAGAGEAAAGDAVVLAAYGVLASEDPAGVQAPALLPRPSTSIGSHLSYTFQWWLFALGSLVGVVVLARREASTVGAAAVTPDGEVLERAEAAARPDGSPERGRGSRSPSRRRARPSAEEEEDALVEAALGRRGTADAERPRPE